MTFLLLFLAFSCLDFTFGQLCETDFDCSLGGKCLNGTNGTYCKCDPTWKSDDCSVLNLLPAKTSRAFYRSDESSWGGSVVYDNNTGLYHMFVADMSYKCGLNSWESNSRVVHAISTTAEGPYNDTGFIDRFPNKQSVASNIWSHNPTVHYIPSEDLYVVYHIGNERIYHNLILNCTNGTTPEDIILPRRRTLTTVSATPSPIYEYPNMVYAQTLHNGHWQSLTTGNWAYNNPAAYFYPNGSLLMIYKVGCPNITNEFCAQLAVAYGESYKGPFRYIRNIGIYGEDPYIWRDINGHFHLLWQSGSYKGTPYYVGHFHTAWSYDGINNWKIGNKTQAFNTTIQLQNGTIVTVKRRERTQLLFDANGYPSHMFNGVTTGNSDFCYTAVQPINTKVNN